MGSQVRCGRRACIMPARSPFGQRSRARDAVSSTRRERPEPLDHEVRHGQRSRLPRSPSSAPRTRTRRPRRVITTRRPPIGSLVPATRCTLACTRERRPRSLPVIVRRLAPIRPSPPASEDLAESAGFVNEKPPVSSPQGGDIGGPDRSRKRARGIEPLPFSLGSSWMSPAPEGRAIDANQRSRGDSNPRGLSACPISSRVLSTAQPPLQ